MSKINKLGKSTFVIAILSFILVAVLAFGGTYAYFSATADTTGTSVTLGTITLTDATATEEGETLVTTGTIVVPNQTIADCDYTTTVNSNIDYYVRLKLVTTYSLSNVGGTQHTADDGCEDDDITHPIEFKITDANKGVMIGEKAEDELDSTLWWADGAVAVTPEESTTTTTTQYFYMRKAQDGTGTVALGTDTLTVDVFAKVLAEVGHDESQHFMGATWSFALTYQVVQADYLAQNGDITPNGEQDIPLETLKAAWDVVYTDTIAD